MRLPGDFRGRIGMGIVRRETEYPDGYEPQDRRTQAARALDERAGWPWYRRLFRRRPR